MQLIWANSGVCYSFLLHAGEQNQRAFVGKEALVNPGADKTADVAINGTRRYSFCSLLYRRH